MGSDNWRCWKAILITEVGAGAIYGYRTPAKVKWSEEYQVLALEEQLGAILSYKDCSGVYIWQFCDVRVTNDWWNTRPRTMNNKELWTSTEDRSCPMRL